MTDTEPAVSQMTSRLTGDLSVETEPTSVQESPDMTDEPAGESPDMTDEPAGESPDMTDEPTRESCGADGGAPSDSQQPQSAEVPPAQETAAAAGDVEAPLSKRQRKRLAKREAFLAQRPALRRAERQRQKEKRAAAVAAAVAGGTAPPKRARLVPMSAGSDVRVVIDLSFDNLMTERDLGKCLKQVQRCYAANRRSSCPVQLLLTSMDGESRRLMDANDGWLNWDVRIERDHVLDVLPPETVTYLTSDSEHQLDRLQPGRAYVIGGLVDHNHHKGECLRRARDAGISHARLPIDDFVEMKTRKVLTIDHVFSILLLVAGGSGWQQALQQVLPARKGAVLKEGNQEETNCRTSDGERQQAEERSGGAEREGDGELVTEAADCEKSRATEDNCEVAGGGPGPVAPSADAGSPDSTVGGQTDPGEPSSEHGKDVTNGDRVATS